MRVLDAECFALSRWARAAGVVARIAGRGRRVLGRGDRRGTEGRAALVGAWVLLFYVIDEVLSARAYSALVLWEGAGAAPLTRRRDRRGVRNRVRVGAGMVELGARWSGLSENAPFCVQRNDRCGCSVLPV
jgi:hypothetical protein